MQDEKGMTEDEMVGWRPTGHEQALGDDEGQGGQSMGSQRVGHD